VTELGEDIRTMAKVEIERLVEIAKDMLRSMPGELELDDAYQALGTSMTMFICHANATAEQTPGGGRPNGPCDEQRREGDLRSAETALTR
jgi:hypothetical protein